MMKKFFASLAIIFLIFPASIALAGWEVGSWLKTGLKWIDDPLKAGALGGGLTSVGGGLAGIAGGIATAGIGVAVAGSDVRKAMQNAKDAILQLDALSDKLDPRIDKYIRNLDRLVQDAIAGTRDGAIDVVRAAEQSMNALTDEILTDIEVTTNRLLNAASCDVSKTWNGMLKNLGATVPWLTSSTVHVPLPIKKKRGWFGLGRLRPATFEVDNSKFYSIADQYAVIEANILADLASASETESPKIFRRSFSHLSELALKVVCKYEDNPTERLQALNSHLKYERMASIWQIGSSL